MAANGNPDSATDIMGGPWPEFKVSGFVSPGLLVNNSAVVGNFNFTACRLFDPLYEESLAGEARSNGTSNGFSTAGSTASNSATTSSESSTTDTATGSATAGSSTGRAGIVRVGFGMVVVTALSVVCLV